jgi:hypothetical protein
MKLKNAKSQSDIMASYNTESITYHIKNWNSQLTIIYSIKREGLFKQQTLKQRVNWHSWRRRCISALQQCIQNKNY